MSLPIIREATHADCATLAAFAAQTFTESFGHLYTPENLQSHLAKHYQPGYLENALAEGSTLLMMYLEDVLIGYGKVGRVVLPVKPSIPPGAQEIHRVYVAQQYQGKGYGKQLMLHILSLPRVQTAPAVYLGVWEENLRAQALYKQYNFEIVGRYLYHVGTQSDRELIMVRKK